MAPLGVVLQKVLSQPLLSRCKYEADESDENPHAYVHADHVHEYDRPMRFEEEWEHSARQELPVAECSASTVHHIHQDGEAADRRLRRQTSKTHLANDENDEQLYALFCRMDVNGDGNINKRELIFALRKEPELCELLGLPSRIQQEDGSREAFERVFQEVDGDDNRELSWEEFQDFCSLTRKSFFGGEGGASGGMGEGPLPGEHFLIDSPILQRKRIMPLPLLRSHSLGSVMRLRRPLPPALTPQAAQPGSGATAGV
jgi:hypothetical protein